MANRQTKKAKPLSHTFCENCGWRRGDVPRQTTRTDDRTGSCVLYHSSMLTRTDVSLEIRDSQREPFVAACDWGWTLSACRTWSRKSRNHDSEIYGG
ncbi:hypothetical protein CEXT_513881 [Caerostris extrusa]|uniref:Uncharacterized protein n=1 Tax=Caerostris extrusa TaxID=172846 RepID=A0AAV4NAL3_CAEEX|nr:hypothetical protein CEXT_513881 [Caerostris extrusa]